MSGLTNFSTGGSSDPEDCANPADLRANSDLSTPSENSSATPNVDSTIASNIASTADSWRDEVAARLERYRTRRKPRTPRYPSLLLPFDAPESWSQPSAPTESSTSRNALGRTNPVFALDAEIDQDSCTSGLSSDVEAPSESRWAGQGYEDHAYQESLPEQSAKVIEFPRSAAIPIFRGSELADPIFDRDRPRIVEAPEILPPPPALGGMLIESTQRDVPDRKAGKDFPAPSLFSSASIGRRAMAQLVDGAICGTALAAFAGIFLRLNPGRGSLPLLVETLVGVAITLWVSYEFVFVVYTGSTPGLRSARLQLAGFDGLPPTRRTRRWRVLASFLSAFSVGLGYFWCVLDQDGLCWHDRITHTHLQQAAPTE